MTKSIYCKNPSCDIPFIPRWYKQKTCSKKCGVIMAIIAAKFKNEQILIKNITQYKLNYNTCNHCGSCLLYEFRKDKFCSHSHAAIYNNKKRGNRKNSTKQKIHETLLKNIQSNYDLNPIICVNCNNVVNYIDRNIKTCQNCKYNLCVPATKNHIIDSMPKKYNNSLNKYVINNLNYTLIKYNLCISCPQIFITKIKSCKTRCMKCTKSIQSVRQSNYLKSNRSHIRGPHKPSYMEESFANWLNQNYTGKWYPEIYFWNHEQKKNGWADFVFPKEKLIIELDGTQHRNTVEKDNIRDEYLLRDRGYLVYRISHKEYINQLKIIEICNLLHINWPSGQELHPHRMS